MGKRIFTLKILKYCRITFFGWFRGSAGKYCKPEKWWLTAFIVVRIRHVYGGIYVYTCAGYLDDTSRCIICWRVCSFVVYFHTCFSAKVWKIYSLALTCFHAISVSLCAYTVSTRFVYLCVYVYVRVFFCACQLCSELDKSKVNCYQTSLQAMAV